LLPITIKQQETHQEMRQRT